VSNRFPVVILSSEVCSPLSGSSRLNLREEELVLDESNGKSMSRYLQKLEEENHGVEKQSKF